MPQFASSDDLAARLGVVFTDDEFIRADALLSMVSEEIVSVTGQQIELVSGDEVSLPGRLAVELVLPQRPVVSVESVFINGIELVEGTQWYLDGDAMRRFRGLPVNTFPWPISTVNWGLPWQTVDVTYTHGFDETTGIVKAVCLEAVIRVWVNPGAIREESYGSTQVTYQKADGMMLTADEKRQLDNFLRRTQGSVKLR